MENIVYIATPRDLFDYLATGATVLLSAIAIIISVSTARRQNKIALLQQRQRIFDEMTYYIETSLPSWEFNLLNIDIFHRYTSSYITAIFDDQVAGFWKYLNEISIQKDNLHGDYATADRKGSCNGRDSDTIESEMNDLNKKVLQQFKPIESRIINKYLKL